MNLNRTLRLEAIACCHVMSPGHKRQHIRWRFPYNHISALPPCTPIVEPVCNMPLTELWIRRKNAGFAASAVIWPIDLDLPAEETRLAKANPVCHDTLVTLPGFSHGVSKRCSLSDKDWCVAGMAGLFDRYVHMAGQVDE